MPDTFEGYLDIFFKILAEAKLPPEERTQYCADKKADVMSNLKYFFYCGLPPGHEGDHKDFAKAEYWPQTPKPPEPVAGPFLTVEL